MMHLWRYSLYPAKAHISLMSHLKMCFLFCFGAINSINVVLQYSITSECIDYRKVLVEILTWSSLQLQVLLGSLVWFPVKCFYIFRIIFMIYCDMQIEWKAMEKKMMWLKCAVYPNDEALNDVICSYQLLYLCHFSWFHLALIVPERVMGKWSRPYDQITVGVLRGFIVCVSWDGWQHKCSADGANPCWPSRIRWDVRWEMF